MSNEDVARLLDYLMKLDTYVTDYAWPLCRVGK